MKRFRSAIHHRSSYLFLIVLFILPLIGASCFKGNQLEAPQPFTLTIWRTTDSEQDFDDMIAAYQAQYPYVDFEVRILRPDEYEQALFDAWARGEGPDIFSLPNYRLGRFRKVIAPMPAEVKLRTVRSEKSTLGGNKKIVEETTIPQLVANQVPNLFVGPVAQDVVFDNQIYGVPLSMDTLAMYYNRDLLSRAQIAVPPTTWEEFVNAVQSTGMVVLDTDNAIVQAGAALGTTTTVPYFFDLLSVLMMQNGVTMLDDDSVLFADGNNKASAAAALSFFTSFSDPSKATYTWNDEQPDALEAFIQGKVAFYFGYYRDQEKIEQRAIGLNFSRTKLPQVNPNAPINYATYPIETVHIQSPHADHAWNFLRFAATSEEHLRVYTESANRIPALATLVGEKQQDPNVDIFAQQSLTARTWYNGPDPDGALVAFKGMIDSANERTTSLEDILTVGAKTVQVTFEDKE